MLQNLRHHGKYKGCINTTLLRTRATVTTTPYVLLLLSLSLPMLWLPFTSNTITETIETRLMSEYRNWQRKHSNLDFNPRLDGILFYPGGRAEVRCGLFDWLLKHDTGHWQGEQTLETQSWHTQLIGKLPPPIPHMTPITSDVSWQMAIWDCRYRLGYRSDRYRNFVTNALPDANMNVQHSRSTLGILKLTSNSRPCIISCMIFEGWAHNQSKERIRIKPVTRAAQGRGPPRSGATRRWSCSRCRASARGGPEAGPPE